MADGTSVVSDRWGTSAGPRALRERAQYASRLRLPTAAENRRNCRQVSPCSGRLPSGRGPNADRPFDEPATSTARRVAAATWKMSSTTEASRAYAAVPARRSRCSRGGASRPGSAPVAGSARHRAMHAVLTAPRAAQIHNLHRAGGPFGVALVLARLRALDTAGVLGRTSSLIRAALVAMSLQELAYQLLAPPVQLPFEFALAHLSGFAGGEEGFGIREDGIGRRAWEVDAKDAGSRPLHVDCTALLKSVWVSQGISGGRGSEKGATPADGLDMAGSGAPGQELSFGPADNSPLAPARCWSWPDRFATRSRVAATSRRCNWKTRFAMSTPQFLTVLCEPGLPLTGSGLCLLSHRPRTEVI